MSMLYSSKYSSKIPNIFLNEDEESVNFSFTWKFVIQC